jgi:AGZA family xanthine/uracil permease-like MFS transporter
MVFVCGVVNIIITVTKIRKSIIKSIPTSLQNAIGGGIGIFIAYIGVKNAGLLQFTSDPGKNIVLDGGTVIADASAVPALVTFNTPAVLLALIGLFLTIIFIVTKVKGAILLGIIATTIIGIPMGVVDLASAGATSGIGEAFAELGTTFGAAFGAAGMGSLFADAAKLPLVLMTSLPSACPIPSTPSEPLSEPDAERASSVPRMKRRWKTAQALSPRWTGPSSPTPSRPPSARFSAPPTQRLT